MGSGHVEVILVAASGLLTLLGSLCRTHAIHKPLEPLAPHIINNFLAYEGNRYNKAGEKERNNIEGRQMDSRGMRAEHNSIAAI